MAIHVPFAPRSQEQMGKNRFFMVVPYPLICRCSDTTPAGRTGNERRHGGGHGAREQLLDGSRAEPAAVRKLWQATTPAEAAVSSAWCLRRLASRIRLCVELLVAHAAAFSTLFLA